MNLSNPLREKKSILHYLIIAIIGSVFFVNIIRLPYVGFKIQLTEILFLLAVPFIPYKKVINYNLKQHKTLLLLIALYALFDFISSVTSKEALSILESIARIYLFSLFFLLTYYFSNFNKKQLINFITRIFIVVAVIIFFMCIEGYTQLIFKHKSRFLYFNFNYPYLGNIYRLCGATLFPAMMISMLNFLLFFFIGIYHIIHISKKWLTIIIIMLGICVVATVSKSLVLTILGLSIFILKQIKLLNKFTLVIVTIIFASFTIAGTHLILAKKETNDFENLKKTIYTSDAVVFQTINYNVVESDYLTVKKASLRIIAEHPFLGIGTGNINKEIAKQKQFGLFPKKLNNLDPHSTYLGAFAENGLFAGVLILAVFFYVLKLFLNQKDLYINQTNLALFTTYIIFSIDAIYTDMLNFRHLWVFMALVIIYLHKSAPHKIYYP